MRSRGSARQCSPPTGWTAAKPSARRSSATCKLADASPLKRELGQAVPSALARSPLYFAAALRLRAIPPRFNRYSGGGSYGLHVDGAVTTQAASAAQPAPTVRSDLSCTLFLSAPEEYDGGELPIHDTYDEHQVKLPAGDLILYPSSSLHRVTPVTRRARLAAFFWGQSLVRDAGRRQTLFDLDTAIQALTASGADTPALLRLTNVHHTPLRDWSET